VKKKKFQDSPAKMMMLLFIISLVQTNKTFILTEMWLGETMTYAGKWRRGSEDHMFKCGFDFSKQQQTTFF